jgi:hypothetical protein
MLGGGVIPVVEFPKQSRNFARIPGISHAFQEFHRLSRRFAHVRRIQFSKEKIFAQRNCEFHWHLRKQFQAFPEKYAFFPGILHAFKAKSFREFGKFNIQPVNLEISPQFFEFRVLSMSVYIFLFSNCPRIWHI